MSSYLPLVVVVASSIVAAWIVRNRSSSKPPPTPPTKEEFVRRVQAQHVYLDSGRLSFVESTFQTLCLLKGKLLVHNRFRTLLLGRKAVGKTFLLHAIQEACKDIFPHIITINITISFTSRTPFEEIATVLNIHLEKCSPTKEQFDLILTVMDQRQLNIFLVVDEFNSVYTPECDKGKIVIEQVRVVLKLRIIPNSQCVHLDVFPKSFACPHSYCHDWE